MCFLFRVQRYEKKCTFANLSVKKSSGEARKANKSRSNSLSIRFSLPLALASYLYRVMLKWQVRCSATETRYKDTTYKKAKGAKKHLLTILVAGVNS